MSRRTTAEVDELVELCTRLRKDWPEAYAVYVETISAAAARSGLDIERHFRRRWSEIFGCEFEESLASRRPSAEVRQ